MERELAELEQARAEAQARWEKAQAGLAEAEAPSVRRSAKLEELEAGPHGGARAGRDVKRESLAQARLELAERRQKVEVLDKGLARWSGAVAQIGDLLVQRQQEIEILDGPGRGAREGGGRQRANASPPIAETLGMAQEQVEKVRTELLAVEAEIGAWRPRRTCSARRPTRAHKEMSAHEVRLAENRQRAQFLGEDVSREFQADVDRTRLEGSALARGATSPRAADARSRR
jgi:chromosome segregation protein